MPGTFRHMISQHKNERPAEIHKQIVPLFQGTKKSLLFMVTL